MLIDKISDTVTRIGFKNGATLTLIGTAHVSERSVDEVKSVIQNVNPDSICIELDTDRWNKINSTDDSFPSLDLAGVIKNGQTFLVLANLILSGFQKKLNLNKNNIVGEEIVSAGRYAVENNIPLTFADRSITVTLRRAWRNSGFMTRMKLLASLITAAFDKSEISEKELEDLKKSSNIEVMLQSVASELPEIKKALIDERDEYLAGKIYSSDGNNKVAVVGAGHVGGLIKTLLALEEGKTVSFDSLEEVPEKSKAKKLCGYIVPIMLLTAVLSIGVFKGWSQGIGLFTSWAIGNMLTTFVFAIISLAHPLNCIVALLTSPLAVLTPILGVGMITGFVEAKLRPPKVRDVETVTDDISSVKGWFKNRVLHTFLVFMLTSIGSTIGTFITTPILSGLFM